MALGESYDLKHDPREREDVLADNEDIARRLIERLVSWRARQRPFERQDGPAMLSLDDAKALESLGYLGRGDRTP